MAQLEHCGVHQVASMISVTSVGIEFVDLLGEQRFMMLTSVGVATWRLMELSNYF